jgi:predicted CopG family antitoxin
MRTLNVTISEIEYNKFGLKQEKLSFTDFIDIVSKELTRQNLAKCLELADKYGISNMTMDEITNEVKAVRKNAKNRN